MEPNPNALAEALREEAAAKARLDAQQSKMKQAQQLINTAGPTSQNRTIFDALGANFDRQRGREMANEVEPKLKKARERAAATYGSKQIYDATRQQDATQYDRRQSRLKRTRQQMLDQQAAEQRRIENERAAAQNAQEQRQFEIEQGNTRGTPEAYQRIGDPTDVMNVIMTPEGPRRTDENGNLVPVSINGYEPVPDVAGGGRGGRSYVASSKKANEYYDQMSSADRAIEIADTFNPQELATLEDVQPRLKKLFAKELAPAAFEQLIVGEFDNITPKMRRFLAEVNLGGAEIRNDLFGSALTTNEQRLSNDFSAAAPGLRLSAIKRRLGTGFKRASDGLKNIDRAYDEDFYDRSLGEYTAARDYLAAVKKAEQEGATPKEAQKKGTDAGVQSLIESGDFSGQALEDLKAIKENPDAEGAQELLQFYMDGG